MRRVVLSCFLAISMLYAVSDHIVAIVDDYVITETALKERYAFLKAFHQGMIPEFEVIRSDLIEELCRDKLNETMWDNLAKVKEIQIPEKEVESFRSQNHLQAFSSSKVAEFYKTLVRKEQLISYFLRPQVLPTPDEVNLHLKSVTPWKNLQAQWSFKLGYFDHRPSVAQAEAQSRTLQHYPAEKISKDLIKIVDWKKIGEWQFIESEGEWVTFLLENVQSPYTAFFVQEPLFIAEEVLDSHQNTQFKAFMIQPPGISQEIWAQLKSLSKNDWTQPFEYQGQRVRWKVIHEPVLDHNKLYLEALNTYTSAIYKFAEEDLIEQKIQQSTPDWYANLASDHYIKVFL